MSARELLASHRAVQINEKACGPGLAHPRAAEVRISCCRGYGILALLTRALAVSRTLDRVDAVGEFRIASERGCLFSLVALFSCTPTNSGSKKLSGQSPRDATVEPSASEPSLLSSVLSTPRRMGSADSPVSFQTCSLHVQDLTLSCDHHQHS
jgi:hypothetical protein